MRLLHYNFMAVHYMDISVKVIGIVRLLLRTVRLSCDKLQATRDMREKRIFHWIRLRYFFYLVDIQPCRIKKEI